MNLKLQDSIQFVKGVGPRRQALFEKLGIATVGDALNFFPRSYEDRSRLVKINQLRLGDRATMRLRVAAAEAYESRNRRNMAKVMFEDDTGEIEAVWFNARYWKADAFIPGREFYVTGKVDFYKTLQIASPQCEPVDQEDAAQGFGPAILPEYPLTESMNQTVMRKVMRQVVDAAADLVEEYLPTDLRKARHLLDIHDAYRNVHFPESSEMAARARHRLIYSEFLLLQLGIALRRRGVRAEEKAIPFHVTDEVDQRIRRRFPFTLTAAQERVIAEIRADMESPKPMNRLLQGDVGSGKTAVALYALLAAVASGAQAALMAPTEILAEQHFLTFSRLLAQSRVRMELVTGGRSSATRLASLDRLARGEVDIAIGTHALVQPGVEFQRLGLVVVDEQHKFGVLQRGALRQKGRHPDVLVMTATPIPRTLSLTVFGDLDVSILDEMPPGRRPVKTKWGPGENRAKVYDFIRKRLAAGEQAFIVYPLVEESEKLDLQAATEASERLRAGELHGFSVGLLHGRMKPDEKNGVMEDFRAGRLQALVSTVVIEVGVDIPNASVMLVEHAERFGLAQLHQLRGRVGRGAHTAQAWFILLAESPSADALRRLEVIASTTDGFRIAEEDLRLRGPGEFFGVRQHGLPEIHIGDIINDVELLRVARHDAFEIVQASPDLSSAPLLRQKMTEKYRNRLDLIRVG